jgi:restriction system protein
MAVPTYDQFIEPILRFLAQQAAPVAAKDAHEAAASALGLSIEQRAETVSSGQLVYKNRAGWGHDRLKRSGYSSSPKRGYWQLTPAGVEYTKKTQFPLPADEVRRLAADAVDVRLRPALDVDVAPVATQQLLPAASSQSPDDRLDAATAEIRASVAGDVLELLHSVTPTFFEHVVLDVLHSLGYGANRSALQRVGGSGDAGIDGIISLDKLGLEKVYVQAKRWQGVVGRPDIQAFFGALAGQRASKGVFITTSGFSPQAVQYAASVEKIVLVDGPKLAELMIDHGVGVSVRHVQIPKVDSDYFEEGAA